MSEHGSWPTAAGQRDFVFTPCIAGAALAEYFALWDQQRKSPVSMAALDEEVDVPAPKAGKQRAQEPQQQPAVDPALKAEQVTP
jgi:hypothetical protein